jgi:hypothetical protein
MGANAVRLAAIGSALSLASLIALAVLCLLVLRGGGEIYAKLEAPSFALTLDAGKGGHALAECTPGVSTQAGSRGSIEQQTGSAGNAAADRRLQGRRIERGLSAEGKQAKANHRRRNKTSTDPG